MLRKKYLTNIYGGGYNFKNNFIFKGAFMKKFLAKMTAAVFAVAVALAFVACPNLDGPGSVPTSTDGNGNSTTTSTGRRQYYSYEVVLTNGAGTYGFNSNGNVVSCTGDGTQTWVFTKFTLESNGIVSSFYTAGQEMTGSGNENYRWSEENGVLTLIPPQGEAYKTVLTKNSDGTYTQTASNGAVYKFRDVSRS